MSAIASEVTRKPSRSAAGAAVAEQQAGMATAADSMTLQQQIRQEMADSLQRVREEMHTAINGRLEAISSISSAMQRISAGPAEAAKPSRTSDLILEELGRQPRQRPVQELRGRAALVDASIRSG